MTEISLVWIEKARLWAGSQEAERSQLPNVAFLRARIETIATLFAAQELETIYLSFPDPYPKGRQALRRLSSPRFLSLYSHVLRLPGEIICKTDSSALYFYTLEQLKEMGVSFRITSEDLHRDPLYAKQEDYGLLSTYERKALSKGAPIHYIRSRLERSQRLTGFSVRKSQKPSAKAPRFTTSALD